MAFIQAQFFSETLNVASTLWAILPEKAEIPRVLTLLHGYSDDHTIWMRRTAVERYSERKKDLAVIMPAVNHSYYCNEKYGERYWDYVSQELPGVVRRLFGLAPERERAFVAGLSMGGYGAMKLALTFPERYAAAGSFSGALDIMGMVKRGRDRAGTIFGDLSPEGTDDDLAALAERNSAKEKPRLYLSCGTKDFLYGDHEAFVTLLEKSGWPVTHKEIPGRAHEWSLWDQEIGAFLDFIGA